MKTTTKIGALSLALSSTLPAVTTAHWRLEEGSNGADVTAGQDSSGNGLNQAGANGSPKYSSNVPGAFIFDPVSNTTSANALSLDVSLANSRINIANNVAFNTSFTYEYFIQLTGEPGGYHAYTRRHETDANRWQLDFDHAANGAFGRGRARFDTPDGDNSNFVVGPQGGASIPGNQRLWIDTPTGDGNPASYTGADWADDGDGVNDIPSWHHVAITFDQNTQELSFYFDYLLSQTRTLADTDSSGYVHPNADIVIGKFGTEYGTYLDEIRYSEGVLSSSQFLVATNVPEPGTALLGLLGSLGFLARRRK
jgi:hypothetical protein